MSKKSCFIYTIFLVLILIFINLSFAGFQEDTWIINKENMQCAYSYIGEKCTQCDLPDEWIIPRIQECPKDYKRVTVDILSTCKPVRSPYCCTIDVEGNGGNCEDVVVNLIEEKCAFVRDISICKSLPNNWAEADENARRGKICPSIDYNWLEEPLRCEGDNVFEDKKEQENETMGPVAKVATFTIIAILIIIVGFFLTKKKKTQQ